MRLPRPRIGIPLKLLAVSSLLAFIPWLGLQYVKELEQLLLRVQEQGLVSTARAVATALNDRPNVLLSGEVYSVPAEAGRDLRVPNLLRPIVLDGRSEDWDQPGVEVHEEGGWVGAGMPPFSFRYRVGRYGAAVFALFEVRDEHVVLRDPSRPELASCDHLQIAVVTADDQFLRFAIDAGGDGPLSAWLIQPDGTRVADGRITGVWRRTAEGYDVELRLPRSLIGPRLSFAVVDVDDPETRTLVGQLGTTATREQLGTVLVPSPEITELIRGLGRAQSRIWVVDVNRRVLAHAGTLHRPGPTEADPAATSFWDRLSQGWARPLSRLLLTQPREDFQDVSPGTYKLEGPEIDAALAGREATRWRLTRDSRAAVLSAACPVWLDQQVRGAVLVEETTNDVLAGRNRGFEKLFAAMLAVSLLGASALVAFSLRLSWRIRRLRDQADQAIDERGQLSGTVRGTSAGDELGDLARSFAGMLDRQRQHTAYLEQVGKRLSHEMRTPVGVVRSSLDNLRLQRLPKEAAVYIERADEGVRRLATILTRMSEATRLEQLLAETEREPFDLAAVVRGCVEGYRLANPARAILLREPGEELRVRGAPDLLAQALDKLVDNALAFARPQTEIVVVLSRQGRTAVLSVANDGPPLPAELQGRLFESMVSLRPPGARKEGEPHLGLGLYIVRLIAQFYGGSAAAHDRPGAAGVIVTLSLPLEPAEPPPAAP